MGITPDDFAPRRFKTEVLPWILFVLIVVALFVVAFHAMMGPVLTTAVVLFVFLAASVAVGVVERHYRKREKDN